MAKDPAFLFYSKDWLEGTAEMMPEEKGVYIDLLAHQHQKGSLPIDTKRLSRLSSLSLSEFSPIWEQIKDKFIETDERFYNKKLEKVMGERAGKGKKNKIIGTFASLLRTNKLSKKTYAELKKSFVVDDFMNVTTEQITERLTEWFSKRLKSIEDVNEDVDILNKGVQISFETFWDLYDKKKGDKSVCETRWANLKDEEREYIINILPKFKDSISDKQFQPFPGTFLNQRRWENEIEPNINTPKVIKHESRR